MTDKKSYYEQTDAQFKVRLSHDLKEKIRKSAEFHNRTMTADIVARLEQSFATQTIAPVGIAPPSSIEQKLDEISQDIKELKHAIKKPLD